MSGYGSNTSNGFEEDPEDSWTRENRRDEMELERKEEDEDATLYQD